MVRLDKPLDCLHLVHSECSMGWGGQEHRVLDELVGFGDRGFRCALLAPEGSRIAERAAEAGVSTTALSGSKLRFGSTCMKTASWLRSNKAVVVNTHSSRDGWLVGLAARWAGVPLLIRSRHIDVSYPNRWVSRHAFTTLADHVVTTSDRITRSLRNRFDLDAERISTVPTGVDLDRFDPSGGRADWARLPGAEWTVGMVSVLRSWKGHGTFLEAIALLRQRSIPLDVRAIIVGDGPQRRGIIQRIQDLGLGSAVHMVGHREDIPDVLRSLNLLVIPSTAHEGIPQIGLQALAVRTPVVGSDAGGIPEIVRPGTTGRLFPAGDPSALAARIEESIRSADQTELLAREGRRLVEREFSRGKMLDRLRAIYDESIAGAFLPDRPVPER